MTDREALRTLLERLDDPRRAEAPAGWNRRVAETRFISLAAALRQRLGYPCPYETGDCIQDASFHGQIFLPREVLTKDYATTVRASNFGGLATIYDDDHAVAPESLDTIVATIQEQGYTYVPSAMLLEKYTGKNPGVEGFRTWGERFFDWV